ncbi:MAG: bifunctional methylenetetrahydrofolate dehydrogenase/methenyltetrahydrofolate cyclohydrolase [Betaproteobacteria bacterium]|nr:bifunctional methylenetetrahydrofolate dehydrogenase/methenyltetrahydrofolate cyclohydrolase [Betaproteobacteria bacterium]
MSAILLDGAGVARQVYATLAPRIAALQRRGVRPGLAAVLAGDDPASRSYIRNKVRACAAAGLHSEVRDLPADCAEGAVLGIIDELNRSSNIHGIIVQLPLPRHLNGNRIVQSIRIEKDVDGFSWHNLGALVEGHPALVPCTPLGVIFMLDHAGIAIEGRHAVVIGRSNIVGKPLALLLISRGATVTVCNSRTPDIGTHTGMADIVIAAAGRPRLVRADMIREGAAVIDVGINRLPGGKLVGDVDFEGARARAGWISPVPGGVGPMTVAMLISNTVSAAERQAARSADSRRENGDAPDDLTGTA